MFVSHRLRLERFGRSVGRRKIKQNSKKLFQSNTIPLNWKLFVTEISKKYGLVLFYLSGILKKSGSVGRWETKQFIGMAIEKTSAVFAVQLHLQCSMGLKQSLH